MRLSGADCSNRNSNSNKVVCYFRREAEIQKVAQPLHVCLSDDRFLKREALSYGLLV